MRVFTLLLITLTLNSACKNRLSQEIDNKKIVEHVEVKKLDNNHWRTYTDIVIDAPIEEVWKTITDWNHLSNWSSLFIGIKGNTQNSGKVIISYLVDGKTYDTPHFFIYKEMVEFGWSDRMDGSFQGLTDNHRFRVEKISENQTEINK